MPASSWNRNTCVPPALVGETSLPTVADPFATEGQRKAQSVRKGCTMQMFEHDPCFDDRQLRGRRRYFADPVHAPQAEQKLVARRVGRCAADHAAVSGLRTMATCSAAQSPVDQATSSRLAGESMRRLASITAAPTVSHRCHIVRIAAELLGPQIGEVVEQVGGGRLPRRASRWGAGAQ